MRCIFVNHYRLRLIESVHQRFLEFASHFICLQIFQIDFSAEYLILSASKYSRYNFWGRNAQFFIGTRQEKGQVECLWEFQIFSPEIIAQIFEEKIFVFFKSPISPWRGPQSKSLFWAFFLNSLWSPSTKKISFDWAPLLAFPNVLHNICKFCFINVCCKFLGQESGS